MKRLVLSMLMVLVSVPAFATSDRLVDRLQSAGALEKIEKRAEQKLLEFADFRLNTYMFKIDWSADTRCLDIDVEPTDPAAMVCVLPYSALHASGYLTIVMATAHAEANAEVIIMNAIWE